MGQVNPAPPAGAPINMTATLLVLGVLIVLILVLLFMAGVRLPDLAPADLTPSPGATPGSFSLLHMRII